MLSIPTSRPLPRNVVTALRTLQKILTAEGASFFVCGALARDIHLLHLNGQPVERATEDIDFGVLAESWERFAQLLRAVEASELFRPSGILTHRVTLLDDSPSCQVNMDLVPFGGVERPDATLAWPPEGDFIMNVAGFAEAAETAVDVEIETGLHLKVASMPALAVLKLIAWRDRHRRTPEKDAIDLASLILRQEAILDPVQVYEDAVEILEELDHELDRVGPALLGQAAASICWPRTEGLICEVLTGDDLFRELLDQMLHFQHLDQEDPRAAQLESSVGAFRVGFLRHRRT